MGLRVLCVECKCIVVNPIKKPKQVQHCIMYEHNIYFVIPVLTLYAYWMLFVREIFERKNQPVS